MDDGPETVIPQPNRRRREQGVLAIGRIQKELDELPSFEAQLRVLQYCMSEVQEKWRESDQIGRSGTTGGGQIMLPPKQPDLPFDAKRNGLAGLE